MTKPVLSIGLDVPFTEAINWAKGRISVLSDTYYKQMSNQARSRAFTVSGIASVDQVQGVLDSLAHATANGQTFADWKKTLSPEVLALGQARLDTIFRTGIQTHYNVGRHDQQERNKAHRPYRMYDAINDGRTRHNHKVLDNFIALIDDPVWRKIYPPNGFRCRCSTIMLTEAQALQRGYKKGNIPHEDGKADKGWDYNPATGQDAVLERIKAERLAKADPGIREAAEKALAEPRKTIDSVLAVTGAVAKSAVDHAVSAINKVHFLPDDMPTIPVNSSSAKGYQGRYSYRSNGEAGGIRISKASVNPGLTAAHEIGHFIDHQSINGLKVFASTRDAAMQEWRDAVDSSQATARLKVLRGEAKSRLERDSIDYYLSRHEQFARSYAQYIATKSGDSLLLDQVSAITNKVSGSKQYKLSQWEKDDFEPISKAMDTIFIKLGLAK